MKRMRWVAVALVALMAASCATWVGSKPALRVGMTPNYPPLAMMRDGFATGAECDFAVQLAKDLGLELDLNEIPWERQFDDLAASKIDIVMSGVTVTPARQARAAFCEPYMNNPLVAVARRGESGRYADAAAVTAATGGIGILRDTAADTFVRRHFGNGKILPLSSRNDVVFYLANQRIDLYVDDLAAAVDIVSRDEAKLELVPIPLANQELAWAVRTDDAVLRQKANEALVRWRENGVLDRILTRWLPYRQALQVALSQAAASAADGK